MNLAFNQDSANYFPRNQKYAGEIGVEIECEGRNLPAVVPYVWTTHADGSLRGESCEYVLRAPLAVNEAYNALDALKGVFKEAGTVIADSQRTSVHVHVNTRGMTLKQVFNFMCMYIIFEDILVEYAGPKRCGNLFCLRCSDADYLIDQVVAGIKGGYLDNLGGDQIRYASMNLAALAKYGSIEFRAFRGTDNFKDIKDWIKLLVAVRDSALKYDNPRDICMELSRRGPEAFLEHVFGPLSIAFAKQLGVRDRMFEGVRMAQEIAFCTDWIEKAGAVAKPKPKRVVDPFNDALPAWAQENAPRWADAMPVGVEPEDDDDIYIEEEEDDEDENL